MDRRRILVVGGVAAGPAAAAEAARAGPDAEVILFEQGRHISYGACEIPYYAAGWIDEIDELIALTPERFEETRGASVRTLHRVTRLDPAARSVSVLSLEQAQEREFAYDRLILATGARARRLGIEGEDAPNVFVVRTLEDVVGVRELLDSGEVERAVVVGGSYIGIEMAEALHARGVEVTIVELTGRLLATLIDDELRSEVHKKVAEAGVKVLAAKPASFGHDRAGRVRVVKTEDGGEVECQLVLVAVGLEPRTELARAGGLELTEGGAVAVDSTMATSDPAVWACGDCVEVERVVDGERVYLPLSPVAFRTARVAARNAARADGAEPERFPGVVGAAAVKAFGLEVASAGLRLEEARAHGLDAFASSIRGRSRSATFPGSTRLHVRLVAERGSGRLLGAEVVGEEGAGLRLNLLAQAMHARATLAEIEEYEMVYAPPIAPSRDAVLIAASVAAKEV